MNLDEQISSAIGAHGLWKGRLRSAVESGTADVPVNVVRDEHQCAFGKWLDQAANDAAISQSNHYRACAELHRRFHQAAADVMSLAVSGQKAEAARALEPGHDFGKASIALTNAMVAWKSSPGAK